MIPLDEKRASFRHNVTEKTVSQEPVPDALQLVHNFEVECIMPELTSLLLLAAAQLPQYAHRW